MKVASLVAFAALAACKPSSSSKQAPAEGSGQPAAAHARGARPDLPAEAPQGSDSAEPSEHHSRLDTNGDGVISPEEREAARAARAKRLHDRYDANHDGKLTPDELAAAAANRRGPRFTDPAALDTNHDGDISADELQAGMREWRVEQRLRVNAGGDLAGSAGSDGTGASAE